MKAKEIQDLIDFIAQSGLEEVSLETEEIKLKIRKSATPSVQQVSAPAVQQPVSQPPVEQSQPAPAPKQESSGESGGGTAAEDESKYVPVKSPMIGTFYRSPNPDTEPFVKVGDKIEAGQPVCIVEAMKLFNEIEAEVSGTIVKVCLENASPVEYDQVLFLVDPS